MGGGLFQIAVPPAEPDRVQPALPDDIVEQCKLWRAPAADGATEDSKSGHTTVIS